MAISADPNSNIEVPPNKAIAASGSTAIGSIIVGLALYYFAPNTPPDIVGLWNALANAIIVFGATYLMPHGAIVKQ